MSPRGSGNKGERPVVPDADFGSYYGRPIVKAAPWKADIPLYFFFGGLASGSSLLAAGADLTDRPALRRIGRFGALFGVSASLYTLVHDLGKPSRTLNMLRVIKPTSPMSVGTWSLAAFGPPAGLAAVAELSRLLPVDLGRPGRLLQVAARPTGLMAAAVAPAVGTYTAVLISDTATPAWHSARRELPFVFAGSAASAAAGLAMVATPTDQAAPARRLAVIGSAVELVFSQRMERSMGVTAETLHRGRAGRFMAASRILTGVGAAGALLLGRRSRIASALSGAALLAGSVCTRFGIFQAGQDSAADPKYTVRPQRERLAQRERVAERERLYRQRTNEPKA
ncbi:polysulfide reductase [Microlunatus elymi]|uniref:Polysulfide reductase n=1 Tax=Microlunatus elymi TaxID=2596828 RepID=A0A516PXY5_9ACTN|nr:NrfD/PsrC family molybdoenzyme membrane anchor subunit [Microlunatus elymi]QDP96039.1 polysulfide reductase [Microlunatus elymi]